MITSSNIQRDINLLLKKEVTLVNHEEFARRIETVRKKLYKTAFLYLGNETLALDAVDEAVYKALCSYKKLRETDYIGTRKDGGLYILLANTSNIVAGTVVERLSKSGYSGEILEQYQI